MWQAQWQQASALLTQVDWPNWLAIAGTSSAISAIVVLAMQGLKERITARRERRDAALEVAVSLEGYARVCRAMMHRAEWARDEATRSGNREAAESAMLPAFVYPEKIQWRRLSHRVVSDLRDFPARIHAGREDLISFSAFRDPVAFCDEVSFESAKAARDALTLARETRKKHGCVPWRPGAKDADLSRELLTLIARAEEKRVESVKQRTSVAVPSGESATLYGSEPGNPRIA
ncbi:hypothetical protein [Caballeronia glebae]|uniref:hypothetical protein n=1 Tax=Caballeronia glebae TaxID=1777143 RepID=UPI0038BAC398